MLDSDFNIQNFVYFPDEKEAETGETACQHYRRRQKGMFDPFQVPADLEVAASYGHSSTLANRYPSESLTKHLLKHPTEFVSMNLGAGTALFYVFRKRMILLLFTILLSAGIYNIYSNRQGEGCKASSDCANNWISKHSLGNVKKLSDELFIQSLLSFTTLLFIIILIHFIMRDQQNLEVECEEITAKIANYTILIKNLPRQKTEAELREDIENCLPESVLSSIKVQDICFAYSVRELLEKKKALKKDIAAVQKEVLLYKCRPKNPPLQKNKVLKKKLDQQEGLSRIRTLKRKYNEKVDKIFTEIYINRDSTSSPVIGRRPRHKLPTSDFTGLAFITLETEQQRSKIVEFFSKTWLQRVFSKERLKRLGVLNQNYNNYLSDLKIEYLFLDCEIYNAPHPEEINWKNLGVNKWWKLVKRLLTGLLIALCLALVTAALWFLSYSVLWQFQTITTYSVDNPNDPERLKVFVSPTHAQDLFSIGFAFLTTCALVLMGFIVRYLHRKNSYIVSTHQEHNIANTLTLVYFYISAVLPLLLMFLKWRLHGVQEGLYSWGGLVQNQMYVFISMGLVPPITKLVLNFRYILRLYRRYKTAKFCDPWSKMQYEVDHIFEGPEEDLPEQMAFTMKTVYLAVFFFPVLPLGLLTSIFGLTLNYWVDKYLLFSRNFVKAHIGSAVSAQIATDANRIPIILGLSCVVFEYLHSESISVLNFFTFFCGLFYTFVPLRIHKNLNFALMRYSKRRPHPPFSSIMQKDFIVSYKETFNRNFLIIGDQDEPTVSRLLLKQNNFTYVQPEPKLIKFSTDEEDNIFGTVIRDVPKEKAKLEGKADLSDLDILQLEDSGFVMTQGNLNTSQN